MHEIDSGRDDFSCGAELVHHRSLIKDIETNVTSVRSPISPIGLQIRASAVTSCFVELRE